MQKTSARSLAEKYKDFHNPTLKLLLDGRELALGEEAYFDSANIISSVKKEPDMAVLTYLINRAFPESIKKFEGYLALGQKMEILAGYGNEAGRIFLGYLHEVGVSDDGMGYINYTLLGLDAKGLMKKNSAFLASGVKKAQQVLDEMLKNSGYSGLLEKRTITPIPAEFNQSIMVGGETDYDWICHLAERLGYEFYCGRGEFIFRAAGQEKDEKLELSGKYGLLNVKTIVSMEQQTGGIAVGAYNRADEKLSACAQWQGASGPFVQKLRQKLSAFSLSVWDMGLETGKQAKLVAENRMGWAVRQCSRMEALHMGLPELAPGICVKIVDDAAQSLCGRIYVEEAEHQISAEGYRTYVRGSRC